MKHWLLRLVLRVLYRKTAIVYNCDWPEGLDMPKQKHPMVIAYNRIGIEPEGEFRFNPDYLNFRDGVNEGRRIQRRIESKG